jgi:Tol biopolymer transport system component
VFKIAAGGGAETKLTGVSASEQGTAEDTWPSWSPDGMDRVRPERKRCSEHLGDRRGHAEGVPAHEHGCMKPTWSADGKALYYTKLNNRDEDLWIATDLGLTTRR